MLIDANLLLYARDSSSPHHERAFAVLTQALGGRTRVGLPWPSLLAFLRIATHHRVFARPLSAIEAWEQVQEWLAIDNVWVPQPTDRHAEILGQLIIQHHVTAADIPDADLAALAIGHGLEIWSADTDFARFERVRWVNPIRT